MTGRRPRPLPLLLALVGAIWIVTAACSLEETMPAPSCLDGGSGLVVAQSVPTAELVPCLGSLPDGWSIDGVMIDQDGTIVRLDSDRAGFGAARLLFRRRCGAEGAVPVPSDQGGARAFEFIERLQPGFRAARIYRFNGGCVRWEFDFEPDISATLSIDLQARLTLVPRSAINDSIRETFIDEEL